MPIFLPISFFFACGVPISTCLKALVGRAQFNGKNVQHTCLILQGKTQNPKIAARMGKRFVLVFVMGTAIFVQFCKCSRNTYHRQYHRSLKSLDSTATLLEYHTVGGPYDWYKSASHCQLATTNIIITTWTKIFRDDEVLIMWAKKRKCVYLGCR